MGMLASPALGGRRGAVARGVTGLVLALAMIVQGCASVPVGVEANDPCSRHRQPMVAAQERFNETVATQAVAGAVIGGLIGGLASGDLGGALAGAVAGGLTGAASGYLQAKAQQAQNRAEVINAINQDVRSSRQYISRIGEGVRRLNTCRANEVADLRRRVQQGQIGGEAAREELAVLRARIADDRRLINAVMGDVEENTGTYTAALAKTQGVEQDIIVSQRAREYEPVVRGAVSTGGRTQYATAGVNVRGGPGTDYRVVGTFNRGQRVGVLGSSGGWSRVDYGGREAYVSARYLADSPPAGRAETQTAAIDRSARPEPANDMDALIIEAKDIRAENEVLSNQIDEDIGTVEALLQ